MNSLGREPQVKDSKKEKSRGAATDASPGISAAHAAENICRPLRGLFIFFLDKSWGY